MRVLVCILTGGRPQLADRPTARLVEPIMADGGFEAVEWVIREDHVDAYEHDDLPMNVYPRSFSDAYSRMNWWHPAEQWDAGGFQGVFPGREWAMRTAEERGFDAVLQLDDNVAQLGIMNVNSPEGQIRSEGWACRQLTEIVASTNVMMCGMQLNSVPFKEYTILRPGFPYSVFVERTGPGRMPYHGPFEEDIMQAMEYGLHGGPNRTVGVTDVLRYVKKSGGTTGMRSRYGGHRGLEISRRYPENARIAPGRRTSSVQDGSRGIRHYLRTTGFTPIRVTDRERLDTVLQALRAAADEFLGGRAASSLRKIERRARGEKR